MNIQISAKVYSRLTIACKRSNGYSAINASQGRDCPPALYTYNVPAIVRLEVIKSRARAKFIHCVSSLGVIIV
jgi:hypothetical protein